MSLDLEGSDLVAVPGPSAGDKTAPLNVLGTLDPRGAVSVASLITPLTKLSLEAEGGWLPDNVGPAIKA